MKQKKGRIKIWKKTTAFLLSAVMAMPLLPGAAYGEEIPGNDGLPSENVRGETTEHVHNWYYEKNYYGRNDEITATCREWYGCDAPGEGIRLTLEMKTDSYNKKRAVVLANGSELSSSNRWDIKYQIKYVDQNGYDIGTEPPGSNGTYRARAIFEGSEDLNTPYLETEYTVSHTHEWRYELWGTDTVSATCQGTGGVCDAGRTRLSLKVETDSGNNKRVVVLANGSELSSSNDWNIEYQIKYFNKNGSVIGTEPPKTNGDYKVRATFGGSGSLNTPYLETEYTVSHTHEWRYEPWGTDTVSATCQGTGGVCDAGWIRLSLKVETDSGNNKRVVVLANGSELSSSNDWNIEYRLKYFDKNGSVIGTEPPKTNGDYKVRATFGGSGSLNTQYLEAEYTINHTHIWRYALQGNNTVKATCQGTEGTCGAGTGGIRFTLDVKKDFGYGEVPQGSHVALLANGSRLDLDALGITYKFTYYNDVNGKPGSIVWTQEPQDIGTYHARVRFGSGNDVFIEDTFTIHEGTGVSDLTVKMNNFKHGASKVTGPSLSMAIKTKTIEYYYYRENGKNPLEVSDKLGSSGLANLDAGTYYVSAKYTLAGDSYVYTTGKTKFQVEKGDRSGITVSMESYELNGKKPTPKLNGKLEGNPEVVYYYNIQNKNTNGIKWGGTEPGKGTYYMYAVIGETSNYNGYTTSACKFTVQADNKDHKNHKWSNMPKNLTSKVQKIKIQCSSCGKVQNITLPKKKVSVVMGKSVNLGLKSKDCTFALGKSAKVKKSYFLLSKKGKITTKANPASYKTMKTSVPVVVKAYDRAYMMTVKLKIPAPKVIITCKKVKVKNKPAYRFEFSYKIPGADKAQVWINQNETDAIGQTGEINKYFKKYFSNPRPRNKPFINLFESSLKKIDNTVTFNIRAYYGSNKSETSTHLVYVQ